MIRCSAGDRIRLYGYSGEFIAEPAHPMSFLAKLGEPCIAVRRDGGDVLLTVLESGIVEINGRAVPLLSAPIAPPAADYPHVPRFSYSDGPQELAVSALKAWQQTRDDDVVLSCELHEYLVPAGWDVV